VRPDADALGSLLGLTLGLEQLGKRVTAVSPDGVPDGYRFLPQWHRVQTTAEGNWDLAIGLDADGSDRLGSAEAVVLAQPLVIDIDHHTGPDPYGQIRLVDRTAAATGELIYHLLKALGTPISVQIATCLLSAIQTDTGSFRFSNVTDETFHIAGALTAAGAHPAPLFEAVYGHRSYGATRLLGRLLDRLQRTEDRKVVWSGLSQGDFRACGVRPDETEGFVDQIRMVEGSEVAIFLREEAGGEIRVSLRSRGSVNVARVAEQFNGGGHVPAAGCTLAGSLEAAAQQVVEAVRRQMS
jgi:phosphoesterase RecJ-like protein